MAQEGDLYHEPYRPQYHFSPPSGWMNDPNGMVYYEGEYHLFYQYSPDINRGPMHWGHAVTTDLIHWQNLPVALYPDESGGIWSGSAVVDAENTSGLVPGGGLVAVFSYENQTQAVAYSTDKGRTWTKYEGNPVIEARAKDFRDPKVFWDTERGQWAMVIAAGQEIQFFTSANLLDWEYQSSFTGGHVFGVWEVPDLFPLEIDGETKWVLLVSVSTLAPAGGPGTQYFVGSFDGQTFINENPTNVLWLDYGPDNYAGTTWDNAPDGQRLYIGWMSNWQYAFNVPTMPWRGAATLPREFRLVHTDEGIRLAQSVPTGFEQLRTLIGSWDDLNVSDVMLLDEVHSRRLEIIAEIAPGDAERFGFDVHQGEAGRTRVVYNAGQEKLLISRVSATEQGEIFSFNPAFGAPLALENAPFRLHIFVDESSVELLAQDGTISITSLVFDPPANDGLALFAEGGSVTFTHLEVYALGSDLTSSETG